jgi:hypothetical protein
MILKLVYLWFGVHWAYVAIMHARSKRLSLYWKVMLYPLAVVGLVLDVAFNVVFGTLMYRELPRELLFTSRCKRHFRGDDEKRKRLASWWAVQLNQFDPGHID